jgi:hypothetical protein
MKMAMDPVVLSRNYDCVEEACIFCTLAGDPVDEIIA